MRYDSVKALKHEIRAALDVGSFLKETLDVLHLEDHLQVSLGVRWVSRNHYHLAVRVRHGSQLATEALRIKTELATKGEVDFRITRPAHIIDGCNGSVAKVTTFNIGGSVGHKNHGGGTLGFFAKRRDDGAVGFVSANHVIALSGTALNDDVIHPSLCDAALSPPSVIARLDHHFPSMTVKPFALADCAFAELLPGKLPPDPGALFNTGTLKTTPVTATESMKVFKIGRTTGKTAGRVVAFDFDKLEVERYPFGAAHFENQIEIESINTSTFSDPGDSGALVFDEDNNPVGLLFAEVDEVKDHPTGLQYATPIQTVIDALGVDILV